MYHSYPSAKDRGEKINELQAKIFDEESASDAQKFLAPPKRRILEKKNGVQNLMFPPPE